MGAWVAGRWAGIFAVVVLGACAGSSGSGDVAPLGAGDGGGVADVVDGGLDGDGIGSDAGSDGGVADGVGGADHEEAAEGVGVADGADGSTDAPEGVGDSDAGGVAALCPGSGPPQVTLPADDGLHEAEIEWWYWTGHLRDEAGRWYGFQITFFAFQMGATFAMVANAALTDVEAGRFEHDAAFAPMDRPEGSAGFDWTLGGQAASGGGGHDVLHGELASASFDLTLEAMRPAVLQHGDGYTTYPDGGYTYYYSRTRMAAEGTVVVDGQARAVTGTAWFDHQWGALGPAVDRGWDWFALQLDDGRDLMLFVLHAGGDLEAPLLVGGTLVGDDCAVVELAAEDVHIEALGSWTSPHTGCTWPSGWRVQVGDVDVTVTPVLADQEVQGQAGSPTYWEGACTVEGSATGRAYVELVGYCPP